MKETKEKTHKAIDWIACTLYLAAIVSISGVLWARYHDWMIVVLLAAAVATGICYLSQGFDLSDALKTISIQTETIRRRSENAAKMREILEKYDSATAELYNELRKKDPENPVLKSVGTSVFGNLENIPEKFSEK